MLKLTPVSIALFSLVGLSLVSAPAASAQNENNAIPRTQVPAPTEPLKITFGAKSASWTPAQLAAQPQTTVTVYNEHTKANETYTGVPLISLLTPLGVHPQPRGKDMLLYLVVEGSDMYEVVYSIGEITPDVSKSTVIVADTENGKPLAADGPLKIVATGENRPARWVRNLVAIHVFSAQ